MIDQKSSMLFGKVSGVTKPISRIVMGTMAMRSSNLPYAFELLDDFFERGGNCLDTAHQYGGGESEKAVGEWMQQRAIRDKIVLLAKGAHTPHCHPEGLTTQLLESLERLQVDSVDIYMLHRDNPEVPVGEFVQCLNDHLRAGRISSFGASNWTLERLQEANDYAATHNLTGFTSSSVNFSLAEWNEPVWPGCVTACDAASREWYQKTQMPLFAWSSQARGFFTGRFTPQQRGQDLPDPKDAQVARIWFNDANLARLERAQNLAQQKGVDANQVALAYVLCQPLNTFAIIGPQNTEETRTSSRALEVELSEEEVKWLYCDNKEFASNFSSGTATLESTLQ